MKKTVVSLSIAAAASAGTLLLTGSPASAATQADVTYARQTGYHGDHRGHGRVHHWHHHGDYYGYHRDGWYRGGGHTRIVISYHGVSIDD